MAELFYLGGVAFGVALFIGFLAGSTRPRTAAAVGVGFALLAAYVVVVVAVSADDPCHHCGNKWLFFVAATNGLVWLVGVAAGGAIRRAVRAVPRR